MALFRRDKKKKTKDDPRGAGRGADETKTSESNDSELEESHAAEVVSGPPAESSPQRVGVVSGVLSTPAHGGDGSLFGSVVERRFGPRELVAEEAVEEATERQDTRSEPTDRLGLLPPIYQDDEMSPRLEVDPMAHIGHATTITGNIVAEEDLEIQGTIEGSVRLANHRVTVGADGVVKATVEAQTVVVIGKITGDVIATDLVEINAGGIIGGDVRAPRVIMHDGAIVVGGLDMSAALPSSADAADSEPAPSTRPQLIKLDLDEGSSSEEGGV